MKKLIYLLVVPFLILSCEDEEAVRIPDIEDGVTMRIEVDPDYAFLDFSALESAEIRFSLFTVNDNIETAEIFVQYENLGQDSVYDRTLWQTYQQSDFNSEGAIRDISFTVPDLLDLYDIESADTLTGGDIITFYSVVTLEDGRVYPDTILAGTEYAQVNVDPGQNLLGSTSSFSPGFVAYVACPSDQDAFVGEYTAEITASSYAAFIGSTNDVTITHKGPEPFRYEISDITALAYAPFGGSEYPGDIYDICGNVTGLTTNTFGTTTDQGNSSWDPETGTLVLNYFEANNEISWTVEFTKKD